MIEISNVVLPSDEQWMAVIRAMRNPLNSWDKSDSFNCLKTSCDKCKYAFECDDDIYNKETSIGENDLTLMKKLSSAGTDHSKYLRMIPVILDINCHHTWWAEFDTYKVGTVRNSCSKMHKIHVKEITIDDFSHEGIDEVGSYALDAFKKYIEVLEFLRCEFNRTQEKKFWRALIEMLPLGFNLKATVSLNYQVLKNIYHARKNHKLNEWKEFCKWIETLPYSEVITG